MKLVSFRVQTPVGAFLRAGALSGQAIVGAGGAPRVGPPLAIVDLNMACARLLADQREEEPCRLAHAMVPTTMLELLEGGASAMARARQAFDYAVKLGDAARGPEGETIFYQPEQVRMMAPLPNPASLRDPAGFVFEEQGRIRRAVTEFGLPHYQAVRATGLVDRLIASGRLLAERETGTAIEGRPDVRVVLEHPPLPFLSYPYEWPFRALQSAALLHLDIQIEALDAGVMLTDASAYNVQFIGPRPVFIDHLAFRPYRPGELWAAHRQFCEQFLHPLLLQSLLGIEFQPWYRGRIDGIPGADLVRLLSKPAPPFAYYW